MKTATSKTIQSIVAVAAVALLSVECIVAENDVDNTVYIRGIDYPQHQQHHRKLYQTQECTLTLMETLYMDEASVGERRRQRDRRQLSSTRREASSTIEFTAESGSLTATDQYSTAEDFVEEDVSDSYYYNSTEEDLYFEEEESDENSTFVITGSGAHEEWVCELAEVDAEASGAQFVKVHGLSKEFFDMEGVISGETTMAAPAALIEGASLEVPQDAEVTLANTLPPEERVTSYDSSSSKSSKSDRRLRKRNVNKTQRRLQTTTGTKRMLVVRVNANDGSTTPSSAKLTNDVFDDANCLRSQYGRCSYNKLQFVKGTGTGVSGGVLTVNLNNNVKGRDRNVVQLEVQDAVKKHFNNNANWRSNYDHVMICLPPGTMGNWIAYAYVNSWLTIFNDAFCSSVSAQMHEVGHNLGLAHSGEIGSYDDQTGLMGFSYAGDDTPMMCFNPVKSFQLGWYSDQTKTLDPPTTGHFRANMNGVDDYGKDKSKLIVVKINDGSKGRDYYIGYNHADGINSGTVEGGNMVWVGWRPQGNAYMESKLLKNLNPYDTYSISNFRNSGKSLLIRFSSKVSDGEAIVDIYYDGNAPGIPAASNPCTSSNQVHFEMDLTTDNYGGETSWTLVSGTQTFASGSGYSSNRNYKISKCIPRSKTYTFEIKDTWGDGICCFEGNGQYTLKKNGNIIHEGGRFQFSEKKTITT